MTPIFGAGELPELRLQPLDPESAIELLGDGRDHLSPAERTRILREAAGNPLALVELPSIAGRLDDDQSLPGLVPLTERMERAFAARAADLPPETQQMLLVAALNDSESLSEVLRAAGTVTHEPVGVEALQPAADAMIVELDERTVRFRHPLMRSAVRQNASMQRRRRVHEALAETLEGEPDRRVWHRAALISGPHEDISLELEATGQRARRRGALYVAMTALRRAAELSDPVHRGRRLLAAGELAVELGQPELAAPLLRDVDEHSGPLERALATLIEEMINPRDLGDSDRLTLVIDAAERAGDAGDRDLQIRLLWLAVHRAWRTDPGPAVRRILVDAARRLGGPSDRDPRVLAIYAYADPIAHVAEVLPPLQAAAAERTLDREPAPRCLRRRPEAVRSDRSGVPPGHRSLARGRSGGGRAPHRPSRRGKRAARPARVDGRCSTDGLDRAESARRAGGPGARRGHSTATLRRCTRRRPQGLAVSARATPARLQEIGQRLYLSHRTISTHLYRIYPKLGITARDELRAALSTPAT